MHPDNRPARIVLLGIKHAPVRKKPEIGLASGAVDLSDLAPGRKIARASEVSRELRCIDLIMVDPDIRAHRTIGLHDLERRDRDLMATWICRCQLEYLPRIRIADRFV